MADALAILFLVICENTFEALVNDNLLAFLLRTTETWIRL